MKALAWCAVRLTDGREWLDLRSISGDRATCEEEVKNPARRIGMCAKANPVVRVARVEVTELPS